MAATIASGVNPEQLQHHHTASSSSSSSKAASPAVMRKARVLAASAARSLRYACARGISPDIVACMFVHDHRWRIIDLADLLGPQRAARVFNKELSHALSCSSPSSQQTNVPASSSANTAVSALKASHAENESAVTARPSNSYDNVAHSSSTAIGSSPRSSELAAYRLQLLMHFCDVARGSNDSPSGAANATPNPQTEQDADVSRVSRGDASNRSTSTGAALTLPHEMLDAAMRNVLNTVDESGLNGAQAGDAQVTVGDPVMSDDGTTMTTAMQIAVPMPAR